MLLTEIFEKSIVDNKEHNSHIETAQIDHNNSTQSEDKD